MKTCSKCGESKPFSEYHRDKNAKDGLQRRCKVCNGAAVLKSYYANKDKRRKYQKEYDKKNADRIRTRNISTTYNVDVETAKILAATKICAICGNESRMKVVDHDHNTGIVRGVLCNKCNLALGGFDDSVELLEAAVRYISGSAG